MKTHAQDWSKYAFERVSQRELHGNKGRDDAKYRTSCYKMPGLIHQSGLVQALVFMCARDKTGQLYVDHLAQTLLQDSKKDYKALVEKAQNAPLTEYLALTHDVAEITQWFRRFAQIELKGNGDNP